MEKHLYNFYKQSERELRESWDRYFEEVMKPRVESAYIELENAKKANDKKKIKKAEKKYQEELRECTRADRYYKDMIDNVLEQLTHVNEMAVAYINGEIPDIYLTHRNAAGEHISEYISGYRFDLMDRNTAKRLLADNKLYAPLFKHVKKSKDKAWNRKKVHSQVAQGIMQGESVDKIADRIQKVTGANRDSAIRNARTMCTTAENRGRMDEYEEAVSNGVVMEKQWMATVGDGRTRDWHLTLDGVSVPVDEPFQNAQGEIMYPGDPDARPANVWNCRCTLVSHLIGFRRRDGSISYVDREESWESV